MKHIEATIEDALKDLVRREEGEAGQGDRLADSLWDHLCRTARIDEQLGRAEGIDPSTCRLAALFHDAGKFHQGKLHGDSEPEEKHSVHVLGQTPNRRKLRCSRASWSKMNR